MTTDFEADFISYAHTGRFTKIVIDYLEGSGKIEPFYTYPVNSRGIGKAIDEREKHPVNRKLLRDQLMLQYQHVVDADEVKRNIEALSNENTFTICTAHQPNIFTGHLYFIYKILHTIKLAANLRKDFPEYNFVPVFFMGSEDADREELNHVYLDGKKFIWNTHQTGAFGRMKADVALLQLIDEIAGRLTVNTHGEEMISLLKKCYQKEEGIEQATFRLIHELFAAYGLVVFLPDNPTFKKIMVTVFEDDLFENKPSYFVQATAEKLGKNYKVQANPRDINLFYLRDGIRNRIIKVKDHFVVHDTDIVFTKEELQGELRKYPERFSPNVILRALFQEMVLPDIAFIGGGGELAYWLELKDVFANYKVFYPMLVLRNSFMVVEKRIVDLLRKLGISSADLFSDEKTIMNFIVSRESRNRTNLEAEKHQLRKVYEELKGLTTKIDPTLRQHVDALETVAVRKLSALEKKLIRAEKRKFADQENQVKKVLYSLFPDGSLQERTENFMSFYSKYGKQFIEMIYQNSSGLEQKFCVLEEKTVKVP
jgi:bacillithiol synthase